MGPTMPSIASVSNIFLYFGASSKALELHAQVVRFRFIDLDLIMYMYILSLILVYRGFKPKPGDKKGYNIIVLHGRH